MLMRGSMRSGSSISQAESPAGRMRTGTSLRAMGRSAGLERGEELLVNVVEPAVRHHHDEVPVPGLLRDGRDNVADLGDVARVLSGGLQIRDELLRGQPFIVGQRGSKHRRQHGPIRYGK